MKSKKTFIAMVLWVVFSSAFSADPTKGYFNLKEGDWFEMKFTGSIAMTNLVPKPKYDHHFAMSGEDVHSLEIFLKYELIKQFPNGVQRYRVSLERISATGYSHDHGGIRLGYDSYYPPYRAYDNYPADRIVFIIDLSPAGNLISFENTFGQAPLPTLRMYEIGPKLKYSHTRTAGFDLSQKWFKSLCQMVILPSDELLFKKLKAGGDTKLENVKKISQSETDKVTTTWLILNDSIPINFSVLKETGVPVMMGKKMMLIRSTFPVPANTIVKGKVTDQPNKNVDIFLKGDKYQKFYRPHRFTTQNDGSFYCPIMLIRPLHLAIKVGDKELTTFMEPGDTLDISGIGQLIEKIEPSGDMTEDLVPNQLKNKWKQGMALYGHKSEYFSGSAANNTMLSNEIDQWRGRFPVAHAIKDVATVIAYQQKAGHAINDLLKKYQGKASATCIDYFKAEWTYFITLLKFQFYYDQNRRKRTANKFTAITEMPPDFFIEADTMPGLVSSYEWCEYYDDFIKTTQQFKKVKLSMAAAVSTDENFFVDFFFSQASLKGYPLYQSMAESLKREMKNGIDATRGVETFYQDFISNCKDSVMVNDVKKVYDAVLQLTPRKEFPVKELKLVDGSIFDLTQYKGKAVSLVVVRSPDVLYHFQPDVEKFDPQDVQFVFAVRSDRKNSHSVADSTLVSRPNVTYLQLGISDVEEKLLLNTRNRIFNLDKWFRIVDDHAPFPPDFLPSEMLDSATVKPSAFEEAVRTAISTSRYSKEERATIYKITGWSVGSILATLAAGLVIYKARIRRLRQQETVKRKIKELEIKAIRSQMNPHFIFNALNSIQSLINADQFREANIYLSKFATLMRGVLNNSEKGMVPLSDELQAVKLYCQLEQLRFEFKLNIEIDPAVDANLIEIPGMLIQPLAENAIVHGLSDKKKTGTLDILISRDNGNLTVVIKDNGKGLLGKEIDKLRQKGYGLRLAEERLNILSYSGKRAALKIENTTESTGTIATLTIPID